MKTRFAPSPTGYMHLGNTRTALFCVLLAKAQQGNFLLRIEDTDQARSEEIFTEQLQADLRWLGLDWQEGPYFQSQRHEIYDEYYQQLQASGMAYPCFCSDQELAIARKIQLSSGKPPRYAGTCRHLTAEQVAAKQAQGMKATLRFRVPDNQTIKFTDFVRGEQQFQSNEIGDFVIRRSEGTAAFFFCNAIDDALMGVTHVLRGEDHLTNTPRQLMILAALNLAFPSYGHMALIVGSDGSPLSKRHGSRSVKELREEGYLSEAIANYLARLGHYYADNSFMNLQQLAENFAIDNLSKSPARFDASQLLYWQKQAVQHLDNDAIWNWIGEEVQAVVVAEHKEIFLQILKANITFPCEALVWAKILFDAELKLEAETKTELQMINAEFWQTALDAVAEHGVNFKAVSEVIQQKLNVKGKALFHPLRLALTGRTDGPEMVKIFEILGKEKIIQRLKNN